MPEQPPLSTLQRFFTGVTEQTFEVKLGVVDPPLVDYLSELLVRFVRGDQLDRLRGSGGQILRELGRMLAEAELRIGLARRNLHRHIGDFALFWAGLFPESLRRVRGDEDLDRFDLYCAQGKRSYLIAGSIDAEPDHAPPSDLLVRLGLQFELCAYGLSEVRREWERRDDGTVPPLLT
jgi:hypothetical protein